MNDEIYKEVPEEFSLQQVRPRFYFDLEMTAKELASRSAIIAGAIAKGDLKIVPAYYNLDSGKVDFL